MAPMKIKRVCLPMLMIFLADLLVACGPIHKSETDTRIMDSFRDTYACRAHMQKNSVLIDSTKGRVTLTGTVPDETHKLLAQDTASGLPSVESVYNRIEVANGMTYSTGSDPWLESKVKAVLMEHKETADINPKISVKNGIATLSGQAGNEAQRSLVSEYTKDVKGIKGVINDMTIAGAKISRSDNR